MDLIVLELTGVHVATHESQKTFSMTLYRGRRSRISGVWEDAGGKKERREWGGEREMESRYLNVTKVSDFVVCTSNT